MKLSKAIFALLLLVVLITGYYVKRSLDLQEKVINLQTGQVEDASVSNEQNDNCHDPVSGKMYSHFVNKQSVNLRESPNTSSTVIEKLDKRQNILLLETAAQTAPDANQFMTKKAIEFTTETTSFTLSPNKAVEIIDPEPNTTMIRVRYIHPELGALEARVPKDTVTNLVNETWVKVRSDAGNEGWLLQRFLDNIEVC